MAKITTYDGLITRAANNYIWHEHFWDESQTATVSTPTAGGSIVKRLGTIKALPTLPTGVTSWIPLKFSLNTNIGSGAFLVGKLILLGTFTYGGTGFTDGSAMPTATEFNTASNQIYSPIMCEVTTALAGTLGTFTITYNANDGTTANVTAAHTPGASAPIKSGGFAVLNTGHWGVSDITAIASSGESGATGVIKFYGMIPLGISNPPATTLAMDNYITDSFNPLNLGAGDVIGVYYFGSNNTGAVTGDLLMLGDS